MTFCVSAINCDLVSPANQLKISSYVNNNTISHFHQRPRSEKVYLLIDKIQFTILVQERFKDTLAQIFQNIKSKDVGTHRLK